MRKAMGTSEEAALIAWQSARPVTAMTMLRDAGYSQEQRAEFLRNVARCKDESAIADFSTDYYVDLGIDES